MSTNKTINKIKELISVLSDLPKPDTNPDNLTSIIRCPCGKQLGDVSEISTVQSAVGECLDKICNDCKEQVSDFCPIICVCCKEVVARLEPGETKNKFKLEKKTPYHIKECPGCNPEKFDNAIVETKLIEEEIYLQNK